VVAQLRTWRTRAGSTDREYGILAAVMFFDLNVCRVKIKKLLTVVLVYDPPTARRVGGAQNKIIVLWEDYFFLLSVLCEIPRSLRGLFPF